MFAQSERKTEKIFVAYIGNGVAAVLERHAHRQIPVVGGLCADELQAC